MTAGELHNAMEQEQEVRIPISPYPFVPFAVSAMPSSFLPQSKLAGLVSLDRIPSFINTVLFLCIGKLTC
jgi:hypothetical protein